MALSRALTCLLPVALAGVLSACVQEGSVTNPPFGNADPPEPETCVALRPFPSTGTSIRVLRSVGSVTPADLEDFDHFGDVLDAAGDVLLIGAPGYDGVDTNQGATYVYRLLVDGWVLEQQIVGPSSAEIFTIGFGGEFGTAVATDGTTIVIGAPSHDTIQRGTSNFGSGRVYVYERSSDAWVLRQVLATPDGFVGGLFGSAVAVDGDHLLIGSPERDNVFLYAKDAGSGDWVFESRLVPNGTAPTYFGRTVVLSAGRAFVGGHSSYTSRVPANTIRVFDLSSARVGNERFEHSEVPIGLDEYGSPDAGFAWTFAVDGDTVVAGAVDHQNRGLLFAYAPPDDGATSWTQIQLLDGPMRNLRSFEDMPVGTFNDFIGSSIDIKGDWLAVGARYMNTVEVNSGGGHLYRRGVDGAWSHYAELHPAVPKRSTQYGRAIAIADGHVLLGSCCSSESAEFAGAAIAFDLGAARTTVEDPAPSPLIYDAPTEPSPYLDAACDDHADWFEAVFMPDVETVVTPELAAAYREHFLADGHVRLDERIRLEWYFYGASIDGQSRHTGLFEYVAEGTMMVPGPTWVPKMTFPTTHAVFPSLVQTTTEVIDLAGPRMPPVSAGGGLLNWSPPENSPAAYPTFLPGTVAPDVASCPGVDPNPNTASVDWSFETAELKQRFAGRFHITSPFPSPALVQQLHYQSNGGRPNAVMKLVPLGLSDTYGLEGAEYSLVHLDERYVFYGMGDIVPPGGRVGYADPAVIPNAFFIDLTALAENGGVRPFRDSSMEYLDFFALFPNDEHARIGLSNPLVWIMEDVDPITGEPRTVNLGSHANAVCQMPLDGPSLRWSP